MFFRKKEEWNYNREERSYSHDLNLSTPEQEMAKTQIPEQREEEIPEQTEIEDQREEEVPEQEKDCRAESEQEQDRQHRQASSVARLLILLIIYGLVCITKLIGTGHSNGEESSRKYWYNSTRQERMRQYRKDQKKKIRPRLTMDDRFEDESKVNYVMGYNAETGESVDYVLVRNSAAIKIAWQNGVATAFCGTTACTIARDPSCGRLYMSDTTGDGLFYPISESTLPVIVTADGQSKDLSACNGTCQVKGFVYFLKNK